MDNNRQIFDSFAGDYDRVLKENLGVFGGNIDVFAEYKIKHLKQNLDMQTEMPVRIFEFGCGIGRNMQYIAKYFPEAEISACDISEESLILAEKNFPHANYKHITTPDEFLNKVDGFDLCLLIGVMHHVPVEDRLLWLKTIMSKLRPNGVIAVFEHNAKNLLTRRIVDRCEFDTDAVLLTLGECCELMQNAGLNYFHKKYTLISPFRNRFFEFIENLLSPIPLGTQFCVMGKRL